MYKNFLEAVFLVFHVLSIYVFWSNWWIRQQISSNWGQQHGLVSAQRCLRGKENTRVPPQKEETTAEFNAKLPEITSVCVEQQILSAQWRLYSVIGSSVSPACQHTDNGKNPGKLPPPWWSWIQHLGQRLSHYVLNDPPELRRCRWVISSTIWLTNNT